MKIAVIGTGIAGNVVSRRLHESGHDISVFEAQAYIGGHTHTHDVHYEGETHRIDTGFIVFNDWTYPNFIGLLHELGVESQPSSMSFSVKNEASGLEYNGTSINSLFAQRRNLFRPSFLRMIRDILRFNREAPALLIGEHDITLGRYLTDHGYSTQFIANYLIPMGAAIWSTDPTRMMDFPAAYLVRFFSNHGMLSVDERPLWRVIKGGSAAYVEKLVAPFLARIRLNHPVESVHRTNDGVVVRSHGQSEAFDQIFFACHSDQALDLLNNPTQQEREVLGALPYQYNEAVLHTDTRLLPEKRLAWAAWNYHVRRESGEPVALTYDMNILQSLKSSHTFCVTLNHSEEIDPAKVIKRLSYHHPLFTREGVAAQKRHAEINGVCRTYFCGAYWRYGFHEDGVISALHALQHFREKNPGQVVGRSVEHA